MNEYYYIKEDKQIGPVSFENLLALQLPLNTRVWREGLTDWILLADLPEYKNTREYQQQTYCNNNINQGPPNMNYTANNMHQGPSSQQISSELYPNNNLNLFWAILATIFCCMPLGIVAIVYAAMGNSAKVAQRYDQAVQYGKISKSWSLAAAICSVVGLLITVILSLLGVGIFGELMSCCY